VVDLANFLSAMGARITGAGSQRIEIEGVKELHGAKHTVIPDRIEAGTFLVAGAISGKRVTIRKTNPSHLTAVMNALTLAGFAISHSEESVTIAPNGARNPLHLETLPYPAFPTDMQAQFCALLATMNGTSVVTESVFPQRFMHVAELKRMGANIDLDHNRATIHGVQRLNGAPVMASDLRASAALVLAALPADGVTEINRVYHIDRGYERIDEKLNYLGAHIERVKA